MKGNSDVKGAKPVTVRRSRKNDNTDEEILQAAEICKKLVSQNLYQCSLEEKNNITDKIIRDQVKSLERTLKMKSKWTRNKRKRKRTKRKRRQRRSRRRRRKQNKVKK